jgi:DNA-binding transcriptional LysR family regulator
MSRRKPSSGPPDPSAINPISIKQALAVAEHLSFRAAARALGVRHSAVSRRVRALEEKLGVTLFERHLTGVTLTNAGVRFIQQAREGFAHLDRASRTAATAGPWRDGTAKDRDSLVDGSRLPTRLDPELLRGAS